MQQNKLTSCTKLCEAFDEKKMVRTENRSITFPMIIQRNLENEDE